MKDKNDMPDLKPWPENMVCERHETSKKWVMWYATDEQAKIINDALTRPAEMVDVEVCWKLEPLAQLIQDELMELGCTAVASECEDIAHKIKTQGYLSPAIPSEVKEALENAGQVFSNLKNAEPESVNDWGFHLDLTIKALKLIEKG